MLRHRLSADLGNLVYPDGRSRSSRIRNWFVWLALRLSSGSCLPTFAGSGQGCPRSDRCWALVAYGLFSLFPDRSLGGLWPALIGWLLVGAATAPPERETVSSTAVPFLAVDVWQAPA